jgi:hypothetical protein
MLRVISKNFPGPFHYAFFFSLFHFAVRALKTGINMEMTSGNYRDNLTAAVKSGDATAEMIDEMVRPILELKYRLGLAFSKIALAPGESRAVKLFLSGVHRCVSKCLSQECLTCRLAMTRPLNSSLPLR